MSLENVDITTPEMALESVRAAATDFRATTNSPRTIELNATVLTAPYPLNNADLRAFFGGTQASSSAEVTNDVVGRFLFQARIIKTGTFNPHVFLTDPCDPTSFSGDDTDALMNVISMHTECRSVGGYSGKIPKIGDIVKIVLTKQTDGVSFWYNIKTADFKHIVDGSTRTSQGAGFGTKCTGLKAMFQTGEFSVMGSTQYPKDPATGYRADPGNFYWSNRARQKVTKWQSTEFPQYNGKELKNGELETTGLLERDAASGAKLVPPALADFKRLAAAYKTKFGKQLKCSGYRTYASQVNVRLKRAEGDAAGCPNPDGKPPGDGSGSGQMGADCSFIGYAAIPGTSNHGWGAAVDLSGAQWRSVTDEFKWMNKFSKRFNFVFGVTGEHWHLDWIKFSQCTAPAITVAQVAWKSDGQSDTNITLT